MTFGSLFAGIGGLDLGLERAGMECKWQVEIDEFCQQVLAKHWPDVPRYGDIWSCETRNLEAVDLVAAGVPCQDISHAGRRAGIAGEFGPLWSEVCRIVRALEPRFVLVENVPSILVRGIDRVLGNLSWLGYDAEWGCLPAAAVGAPHLRARIFILAYTRSIGDRIPPETIPAGWAGAFNGGRWAREPGMVRVADGVPNRVDRLGALGNAVVPQVAEWIGRRIRAAADRGDDG